MTTGALEKPNLPDSGAGGAGGAGGASPEETAPCVPGTTIECYTGPAGTEDVGVCHGGQRRCGQDGRFQTTCDGEITPSNETCATPEDDDCDGYINEGGYGCVCLPESASPCYEGPKGTENVGSCRPGLMACNQMGTAYSGCFGQTTPAVEDCATEDDDNCDGEPNDHCAVWSAAFGGAGDQFAFAAAVDKSGNTVLTGSLGGSVNFGGDTLTTAGGTDAFVVKLDSNGKHLWSKRFGDSQDQLGRDIAVDKNGNVIVIGTFKGSIGFSESQNAKHTSSGAEDVFVVKLDPNGKHVWSRRIGGSASQIARGIAVDSDGDIVAVGDFTGTTHAGGPSLTNAGSHDGFVVKLEGSGDHVWSKAFGGAGTDSIQDVALGPSGEVHLTGYFTQSIGLGNGTLTAGGGQDGYVVKLSPAGTYVWGYAYSAPADQRGHMIAVDASGNIALLGEFSGTLEIDGKQFHNTGPDDLIIVRLGPAGNHIWSKAFGEAAQEEVGGLAIDDAGDVVIVAEHEGAADFGGGVIHSAGNDDVVSVKLDGVTGEHLWSRRFGDFADQDGRAVVAMPGGGVTLVGEFSGSIDFGAGKLTSASGEDIFLAHIPP